MLTEMLQIQIPVWAAAFEAVSNLSHEKQQLRNDVCYRCMHLTQQQQKDTVMGLVL